MRNLLAPAALMAALTCGCMMPPGPTERLNYAAHDMNAATRFGRLDVAMDHVAGHAREDFAKRHASWGRQIRVLDVEMRGLRMITPETAEVQVAVSWHDTRHMEIQVSYLAQKWTRKEKDWALVEELRVGGAGGLFSPSDDPFSTSDPAPMGPSEGSFGNDSFGQL